MMEAFSAKAAILAGFGTGLYPTVSEGVRRAVVIDKVYKPDPERSKAYQARLAIYRDLHSTLRPVHGLLRSFA